MNSHRDTETQRKLSTDYADYTDFEDDALTGLQARGRRPPAGLVSVESV